MAYVSKELKAQLAPVIKAICKKYNIKATIAVAHHSTLVLNISQGPIDFIGNYNKVAGQEYQHASHFNQAKEYIQVNTYHYNKHFDGTALAFLSEVIPAMNTGNWDKSDIQTDYFNVGWYISVNIGRYGKPYAVV